ncbi:MAG: S-methyl-5-thioribose-1-phosphate isomerase [Acidimicrobiia bacterium]|nr:S-methyl-5-thioribose-1-phosphate isomerase [Acidimicrobiia bacterium]
MSQSDETAPRTVWIDPDDPNSILAIEQRLLPFEYIEVSIRTADEMAEAIVDMVVRGAGCIGVSAGYGMYLAAIETRGFGGAEADEHLHRAGAVLEASRPTAVNLTWAVQRQLRELIGIDDGEERVAKAREVADAIANEDVAMCASIGQHGLEIIREIHERTGRPVNIMTHCNAGWLAFVSHGTATAPMYAAFDAGIPIHVWVSETRPRNQGARLTAWELGQHGVPHTLIADNSAGHLMQHGKVDLVIVGSDRTTVNGDVANKIGTYMKAVAARDNDVPFYAALPSSTFDPALRDGVANIPIEERDAMEVTNVTAWFEGHQIEPRVASPGTEAVNFGFDVTPARLLTGIISERGISEASEESILALYPEFAVALPPPEQSQHRTEGRQGAK